jgi:hypothetical protein
MKRLSVVLLLLGLAGCKYPSKNRQMKHVLSGGKRVKQLLTLGTLLGKRGVEMETFQSR